MRNRIAEQLLERPHNIQCFARLAQEALETLGELAYHLDCQIQVVIVMARERYERGYKQGALPRISWVLGRASWVSVIVREGMRPVTRGNLRH